MKAIALFALLPLSALAALAVQAARAEPGEAPFSRLDANGNAVGEPSHEDVAAYSGPGETVAPDLAGVAPVPSDFDVDAQILPSPDAMAPSTEPIGAFRIICQAGQLNWDDPIVYPGQPNASPHLHQWFGNTEANALSNYRSLRASGDSTCMGRLNRSAYWIPAMISGPDTVVRPDYLFVYYKRYPQGGAECAATARACIGLPHGLRYIFGYDMRRIGRRQTENLIFTWKCVTPDNELHGETSTRLDRIDCPPGHELMVTLSAPDCWDGRNLDSADHRSHMAYRRAGPEGGLPRCPRSHPYLLPEFTLGAVWQVRSEDRVADWHLASDRMPGMPQVPAGGSFHADWYGAWDEVAMRAWTDNCIDRKLSCVDGGLGDGTAMKRPPGFGYSVSPRVVPLPPRPTVMAHHD